MQVERPGRECVLLGRQLGFCWRKYLLIFCSRARGKGGARIWGKSWSRDRIIWCRRSTRWLPIGGVSRGWRGRRDRTDSNSLFWILRIFGWEDSRDLRVIYWGWCCVDCVDRRGGSFMISWKVYLMRLYYFF